jgi:signal transduction histidine kinase/ligand-binding sensor domain-containing protein
MRYPILNLLKAKSTVTTGFILVIFLWPSIAFTQRKSFTNYGIEDGLPQSQVVQILQDNAHQLVLATYLGVTRFDGKTFTPVSKDNVSLDDPGSAAIDNSGRIWCSNYRGLYYFYADKTTRFVGNNNDSSIIASQLIADNQGNIWGLRQQRLFKITGGRMENISVTGGGDTVTDITINKRGELLAAVVNKGIFCLRNNKWINTIALLPKNTYVKQFLPADDEDGAGYISTGSEILSVTKGVVKKVAGDFEKDGGGGIYCIALDGTNGLWIGTNKGAYYFNDNKLEHFDGSNGFTNFRVNYIFRDIDNNIWLGTNGGGLYRFDGDAFLILDQVAGVIEPVLQMAADKDDNILMTGGTRLTVYDGKKIRPLKIPHIDSINNLFHCLYTDPEKNTWVVTQKQLWEKNGSDFKLFYPRSTSDPKLSFNAIAEDQQKTMWTITSSGCYYWDDGFKKISGADVQYTGLIEIGRDSMLLSNNDGVFLVKDKKIDHSFKCDILKDLNVMCLKYYKGRIYIGTFADGMFIWNPHGGPVTQLTDKNGLSSISVYSIDVDKNDVLWVGTGRAVNQFKIKANGTLQKIINDNISNLFVECNQDAIVFNKDRVWMGTTKGVLVFKNDFNATMAAAPYTTMQDVLFYNKQAVTYTYSHGYKEPQNLKLPFDNSHITLSFNGIYLKNPRNVLYSYKLWPLDTRYCAPVNNNVVDYPSLPPGTYTFYVRSYNLAGARSNIASFSFEVTPAWYQTALFKVTVAILLALTGVFTWKYVRAKEEQKRRLVAQLRLEEQVKIRKQTAEDFHDDLGNKLTRINVLSDILYKKIDGGLLDQRKLIDQIKENADALFTGSKHILWALDPDNDRLSEVLIHIKEFGIDLFLNTDISFTSDLTDDVFEEITLPMGYGRNITMIFKELFNNALKHSGAENVSASAFLNQDNDICVTAEDDGKGFDADTIKSGNGLRNMNNRAKKLNGVIELSSTAGEGTRVTLIIKKIPQLYR